jgi:hypothetical protein
MNYQPFLSILIFYCALCVPSQAQSGFVVCGSNIWQIDSQNKYKGFL